METENKNTNGVKKETIIDKKVYGVIDALQGGTGMFYAKMLDELGNLLIEESDMLSVGDERIMSLLRGMRLLRADILELCKGEEGDYVRDPAFDIDLRDLADD